MAIWIVASVGGADCGKEATELNESACEAGTGIGVAVVFFLWFLGFIPLSIVWFMTRPRGRPCPVCGNEVKRGQTACASCGYDFRSQAMPVTGGSQPD